MTVRSATPVFRTGDYRRSKAFWTDILGFACVEEAGEPAGFGIFIRDNARIFVEGYHGPEAPYHRWRAYFHVTDFDSLVAEVREKGGVLTSEPVLTEYDMREFEITDPDGNTVCFGADP